MKILTASHGKKLTEKISSRQIALLGALCLFLSAVEYMIPKPLPFLRIGLANLPLMLALGIFPLRDYFVLICIKIPGQAIITGTLFSYVFLFSAAGTFFSAFSMYFLYKLFFNRGRITFIGIGTAGAFISNITQLFLAYFFIFNDNTFYIAPAFLITGLITGIALGAFCQAFAGKSVWRSVLIGNNE